MARPSHIIYLWCFKKWSITSIQCCWVCFLDMFCHQQTMLTFVNKQQTYLLCTLGWRLGFGILQILVLFLRCAKTCWKGDPFNLWKTWTVFCFSNKRLTNDWCGNNVESEHIGFYIAVFNLPLMEQDPFYKGNTTHVGLGPFCSPWVSENLTHWLPHKNNPPTWKKNNIIYYKIQKPSFIRVSNPLRQLWFVVCVFGFSILPEGPFGKRFPQVFTALMGGWWIHFNLGNVWKMHSLRKRWIWLDLE